MYLQNMWTVNAVIKRMHYYKDIEVILINCHHIENVNL